MSAPLIKFYRLDETYSEDGDNDIQTQQGDHLVPVRDRSQLLSDAKLLTGILPVEQEAMQPVDLGLGRQSYNLVPPSGVTQTPVGVPTQIVDVINGELAINVYQPDATLISRSDYEWDGSAFTFNDGVPPPSGGYVSCYVEPAGNNHTAWALRGNTLYDGENSSYNKIRISIDSGPEEQVNPATAGNSYVSTVGASGVTATYAITQTTSKWFIGAENNWVTDHLHMRPDVFVGTIDYPGDQTTIGGIPVEPGLLPAWRDPQTYSLQARDGLVNFPEAVNSLDNPVKANYAFLVGIDNVTNQQLDDVGPSGTTYRAVSETAFPDSHGKHWVRRNSLQQPLNIYVDGVTTPQITTVTPYDQLSIKTGP